MDRKIKNIMKMGILVLICMTIIGWCNISLCATSKENNIKSEAEKYAKDIDLNNINKEDILNAYEEISQEYTNEELSNFIDEYKEEIKQQGISEEAINAGKEILKTTDKESVKEIIKNDIDFDKIQEKIDSGATINQAVKETVKETSTDKKIELGIKVLLANKIVRISLIICVIIFVYEIIVRWIIYKKAGRHGWAAIVPIYRQITMYKVSGLSPWLILLILIPIIGAFIIAIIEIIQKFKLSKKFGKGVLFGFGLQFLQPIFESIIAFSKKIKYKG